MKRSYFTSMRIRKGGSRRAISPVLATVILIAITLIAAVAISGFVFGLMGTYTSVAEVSSSAVGCSGTPEVCTVALQNTGSANVVLAGTCTLSFGGGLHPSTAALLSGNLNAGSQASVSCTSPGSFHAVAGTQITGSIALGNGAEVLFAGTAS
jgi:flagellin-like protein